MMQADEAEKLRLEALRSGDAKALDQCLDDNFVYIHGTGRIDRKFDYVDAIESKDLQYEMIDFENMTVNKGNGFTNIVYDFHATRTRGDNPPVRFHRRVLAVWLEKEDGMILTSLCMTPIADEAAG